MDLVDIISNFYSVEILINEVLINFNNVSIIRTNFKEIYLIYLKTSKFSCSSDIVSKAKYIRKCSKSLWRKLPSLGLLLASSLRAIRSSKSPVR